jgi:membrane protease YdiL (CAAX protease family)
LEQLGPLARIAIVIFASIFLCSIGALTMRRFKIDPFLPTRRSSVKGSLIAGTLNLVILVTTFVLFRKLDGKSPRAMGFRFDDRDIIYSLVVLGVAHLVSFLIARRHAAGTTVTEPARKHAGIFPFLFITATLFLGAWQEEVVFRGYLFANLAGHGALTALAISTVLFTLVHFVAQRPSLWKGIDRALGGIVLGVVYLLSGSIWVATLTHFAGNLANVALLLGPSGFSLLPAERPVAPRTRSAYYLLLSIVVVALAALFYGTGPQLPLR